MRSLFAFPFDWKRYLGLRNSASPATGAPRDLWRTRSGAAIGLRAARADDGDRMQALVRGLSLQSRYQRFFYPARELPPDMLARFTHNAAAQAMTLLAVVTEGGEEKAVAMAQYVADPYPQRCDFAVVVADAWQREGIATRLLQTLVCLARNAGIERMEGDILGTNDGMFKLMLRMGFTLARHEDGAYLVKASRPLQASMEKCPPLATLLAREHAERPLPVHA